MNSLIRPALYEAYHEIANLSRLHGLGLFDEVVELGFEVVEVRPDVGLGVGFGALFGTLREALQRLRREELDALGVLGEFLGVERDLAFGHRAHRAEIPADHGFSPFILIVSMPHVVWGVKS